MMSVVNEVRRTVNTAIEASRSAPEIKIASSLVAMPVNEQVSVNMDRPVRWALIEQFTERGE